MKEIEFRAWHEKLKRMIYNISVCDSISEWDDEEGKPWCFEYPDIMQFTGLKDKNGKKIYEGELLKHNRNLYKVIFSKNQHVLLLKDIHLKTNWRSLEWCNNVSKYIEVIGNIYENKNLIKS